MYVSVAGIDRRDTDNRKLRHAIWKKGSKHARVMYKDRSEASNLQTVYYEKATGKKSYEDVDDDSLSEGMQDEDSHYKWKIQAKPQKQGLPATKE